MSTSELTARETDVAEFRRHRGPVTCVAGIPNRNAAVTSGYDGAVAYVDLDTRTIELLGYHDHLVNKVSVNAAGTMAGSASSDYTVYIWDLVSRRRTLALVGHSDDVEDFTFVDDHTGVSVSRDWRVLVWNLDTGAIRHVIDGHQKDVLSVVAAGSHLYTAGDDMTLRVWDVATGKHIRTWGPFEDETDSCAIDPVRGRAVLGCDDGVVRIFDVGTGEAVAAIPAHSSGIKKVAVSPTTGDILSAAYDQRILVWSARDLTLKVTLEPRATTWERSFNWSPDGTRLLAGTFDGTVLVWDAATGRCVDEIGQEGGNACLNDVGATGAGEIVTVSDDGRIRVGRLTAHEADWLTETEPASGRMLANAIAVDEEYGLVATGTHDQKLHIFAMRDDALEDEIEVPLDEGPINAVRVAHHDGFEARLFVACYSGAIVQVGRDGTIHDRFRVHEGAVKSLRLHPSDTTGVSCSADGALLAWDFAGDVRERFPGHMAIVDDVDIDPDGRLITSVSRDFTMKVYELQGGRLVHSFPLGRRSPKAVCFYDPGTVIVTNYWGTLIRVSIPDGAVRTRSIARNGISAIARRGEHVVVVSYDGAAYLVDPTSLEVVNTLRYMTQRLEPSALI